MAEAMNRQEGPRTIALDRALVGAWARGELLGDLWHYANRDGWTRVQLVDLPPDPPPIKPICTSSEPSG
jgi:hypothetical protein